MLLSCFSLVYRRGEQVDCAPEDVVIKEGEMLLLPRWVPLARSARPARSD